MPEDQDAGCTTDLKGLNDKLAILRSTIAGFAVQLEQLTRDVVTLRNHVSEGNGEPGLLVRVQQLETDRKYSQMGISGLEREVIAVGRRMDTLLTEFRGGINNWSQQLSAAVVEARQAYSQVTERILRLEGMAGERKWGYMIALGLGVLSFVGDLVRIVINHIWPVMAN